MRDIATRIQQQLRRSRMVLFTIMPFALLAATGSGALDYLQVFLRIVYIVAGFSLIIFLHELGHFVVARLCSVKCLAFSIGIGPRMFGYKKGVGFNFGAEPKTVEISKEEAAKLESDRHGVTFKEKASHVDEKKVGDCDYRISWLPLGGYVRMLGQDDMDPSKISEDPHAFNQRPIWQRMCIVSAGVIMNIIFAAVCFSIIFSPGIGVDFPPAVLGTVVYDSPAWKAGLRPGDAILSINGQKPRGFLEFTDIQMESALSSGADKIKFEVKHAATGKTDIVEILPVRSEVTGFLAIGVESIPGTKLVGDGADYKKTFDDADKKGDKQPEWMNQNKDALLALRSDDKVMKVDGVDIHNDYQELYKYVQSREGQKVTLTLANAKGKAVPSQDVTIVPHMEYLPGVNEFPRVMGLAPRLMVAGVQAKSPAEQKGVKPDDHIIRVGDRSYPTAEEMIAIVLASGGQPLDFTVERPRENGPAEKLTFAISAKKQGDNYRIGVAPAQDIKSLAFMPVDGDSPLATLPLDATIASIDGTPVGNWTDVYRVLRGKSAGELPVAFKTAGGEVTKQLAFSPEQAAAVRDLLHYQLGIHLEVMLKTQRADNAWEATLMGMDHTKKFIANVYMTLAGLFRRTVDPSNLHGIVGITKVGYDVQERGPVWLWYLLAMVSVNLAVANFLPLPIVDGGLFLLLIVEKIRGKPLSLKVQTAIQTVGIVLLAGLFLFVTYNDITGMLLK